MCLTTKMKVPAIAEKDIICYKVICKDMSSFFHNDFKWEFGKMYYSRIEDINDIKDRNKEIHKAFHSYETLEDLKKAYYMATVSCLAVKCTIPSGSKVYTGRHDNLKGYASNQLMIDKVIDAKELYPDFDWDNYPYKEGQVIQININKIWGDYQITNIQPQPMNNSRVDLIVKDCSASGFEHPIRTIFDGKVWQSKNYVILSKNKEE